MGVVRVQASINPHPNAALEDYVVNTFHFRTPNGADPSPQITDEAMDNVQAFYEAIDGDLMNQDVVECFLKVYDLTDPEPRAPIGERNFGLAAAAEPKLPEEMAICCSYSAALESGVPRARRQGRIYIGCLKLAVLDQSELHTRVSETARGALAVAAGALIDAGTNGAIWSVLSVTDWDAGMVVYNAARPIIQGYVDDAFDVQRRRGPKPSDRTPFQGF